MHKDSSVIEDNAIVHEPFHILNDMRRHKHSFILSLGIFSKIIDKKPAITGV